ncbi:MAG TPA: hypothetical protein VFP54_09645 [Acidimicrobiales bacterium]|nr:hypothetical protein [Acidimicrobiales bacterium]
MPHRIDVELTSLREDGTWTWRAAGARQPRGVVEASVLYQGAKVGDVVRAEAEFEMDGITILSVQPPREKRESSNVLEITGPGRDAGPGGVTTSLVSRSERPRRPRQERPGGRERTPRPGDEGGRRAGPRREDAGRRQREGAPGEARGPRPTRTPDERPRRERAPRPERPAPPERVQPKRLNPAATHRNAVLESLPAEQRPVAEQLIRGGIPAVRQAIAAENDKAKAEGRPAIGADALMALAEGLLPQIKAATWRDRAEAAVGVVDEIAIRDLRSVVAGADVARDEETRALAATLRQALERRLEEGRQTWVKDITTNLDENRVVRALRISARPPDPSSRIPADMAVRLAEAASAALAPDTPGERWVAVLDAVSASPVRRSVKPAGLPAEPDEAVMVAARAAAGRVPAVAALLGLSMPPPPGPARPAPRPPRPARGPQGPRSAGQGPRKPSTPPPSPTSEGTPTATVTDAPSSSAPHDAPSAEPVTTSPSPDGPSGAAAPADVAEQTAPLEIPTASQEAPSGGDARPEDLAAPVSEAPVSEEPPAADIETGSSAVPSLPVAAEQPESEPAAGPQAEEAPTDATAAVPAPATPGDAPERQAEETSTDTAE